VPQQVRSLQAERADELLETISVLGQTKVFGRIGRRTAAGRIPGHHGEDIGERFEFDSPHPTVAHRPMQKQQTRTVAAPLEYSR